MKQVQRHCFSISAFILTLLNVVLFVFTWKFNRYADDDSMRTMYNTRASEIENKFNFDESLLDSSGRYFINENVYHGARKNGGDYLTLVTHCTFSNLIYLPFLMQNWAGSVSIALFVDTADDFTLILKALAICNLSSAHRFYFHVVRPVDGHSLKDAYFIEDVELNSLFNDPVSFCFKFERILLDLNKKKVNYEMTIPYPNNLLRNVARRGAVTDYILHLDVDMMPSKNLHQLFNSFVERALISDSTLANTVYIMPSFEVKSSYFVSNLHHFPIDKDTLFSLVKKGLARPFYTTVCNHCQNSTNYAKWWSLKNDKLLQLAYGVAWVYPYEPLFISSKKQTPFYDEKFTQYGYNRLSLVCEMHIIGWQFKVLNSAFVLHIGFKDSHFHSNKQNDMNRNWKYYRKFLQKLAAKYPHSNRTCDPLPVYKG